MSPFLFSDVVYKWLDSALYYGITEWDFWDMTLAELVRAVNNKKRLQKEELQAKATFDYALADLIGRSVARIHNSANNMPDIDKVYPSLFDSEEIEEIKQENKNKLFELQLRQFAQSHNIKLKK